MITLCKFSPKCFCVRLVFGYDRAFCCNNHRHASGVYLGFIVSDHRKAIILIRSFYIVKQLVNVNLLTWFEVIIIVIVKNNQSKY